MKRNKRIRAGWGVILVVGIALFALWYFCGGGNKVLVSTNGRLHESLFPAGGEVEIVKHRDYALGYYEPWEQAKWVIETVDWHLLRRKNVGRTNDFRPDPLVSTGSATTEDYRHSGYDRGHLAPAADFAYSQEAMKDSFYMSNMSPQHHLLNRISWKNLEEWVRKMAYKENTLVVVTGPVVKTGGKGRIGKNQVLVPDGYYKAVFDVTPPKKMIAFYYDNEKSVHDIRRHVVTVDEVERMTGLNLFASLPDDEEDRLEASANWNEW